MQTSSHPKVDTVVITRFPYESSWGGEESHTLSIARHLKEKGQNVIFMGSCPFLLERFQQEGFEVHRVWGGKMIVTPWELLKSFFLFPFISWNMKRAFQKIIQKYHVKALYSLSLNEKLFLASSAIRQGIPVTWVEHQEVRGWLLKSPWKRRYKKLAQKVQIVPISKKNERTLMEEMQISSDHLTPITNGVSVAEISATPSQKTKGLIVAANRLIPKKGMLDVVQALTILKERNQAFSAQILGEGEEEQSIRSAIENMKDENISFNNFLKKEKWRKLLSETEVFVSSARDSNETFSLNCAEAMASGCKLVITSCTGIADYITNSPGVWICQPNDPQDMAEKISEALQDKQHLVEALKKEAREKFDEQRMLEQYENLILRKT